MASILLVENDDIGLAIYESLQAAGHGVIWAKNYVDATREIMEETDFGIALINLNLMSIDGFLDGRGYDLLEALDKEHPHIPKIVLTAFREHPRYPGEHAEMLSDLQVQYSLRHIGIKGSRKFFRNLITIIEKLENSISDKNNTIQSGSSENMKKGDSDVDESSDRASVFISYSHRDSAWLDKLKIMLVPLIRKYKLDIWDDRKIGAGSVWMDEIQEALKRARVVVLLVSPNFLASEFIHEHELSPVLKSTASGEKTIIWMLVSSCLYKETDIGKYQAAHDISQPLDTLPDAQLNRILVEICGVIKTAVEA